MWLYKTKNNSKKNDAKNSIADSKSSFFHEIEIEFLIHELKDPISIIETGLRTLLERREKFGPLTEKQEKTLVRVLRNTKKTRDMMHSLLEIGRAETGHYICGQFRPVEILYQALIDAMETQFQDISDDFRHYREHDKINKFLLEYGISLDIDPHLTQVMMTQDEIKFRQITGNLFKNALHHRKNKIEIKFYGESENMLVEVTDDGPGIDPEYHEIIFQRYAQVNICSDIKRTGHGLGLAGANILARFLGGKIEINSKQGEGATFRLMLPFTIKRSE